ncbi:AAA family ATPase [Deinococcus sp.]|uniref:AAA family ATPase n=1 Tax=Deinococcus sp. TaxID=47478 RepID=UPI003C7E36C3
MPAILITGLSGTGKSSALHELARLGHRTVDTDEDGWCEWAQTEYGPGWVWREDRMTALLEGHTEGTLYVSGCLSNQGRFYPQFSAVVLLSAPRKLMLHRLATRTTNPYGKRADERQLVLEQLATVEPLLRATATVEIDTSKPLAEVVAELVERGAGGRPSPWPWAARVTTWRTLRPVGEGTRPPASSRRPSPNSSPWPAA